MEPFKNRMSVEAAKDLSRSILKVDPKFNQDLFLKGVKAGLEPLELKGRVKYLKSRLLAAFGDQKLERSLAVLADVAKYEQSRGDEALDPFTLWPLTQFVEEEGLPEFEASLRALYSLTQVFTAEFAIRPFLIHETERTLKRLEKWAEDPSEHVRRLVSEGTRPLLPWGQKLHAFVKDPDATFHLLDALKNDPERYVYLSVANHMNDHAKNHPEWTVKKLKGWHASKPREELLWVVRHASRSLIKRGVADAFVLHGVSPSRVKIQEIELKKKRVSLGQNLEGAVWLKVPAAKEGVKVVLDYSVYFLKANGRHQEKVFKGKKIVLPAGAAREVSVDFRLPLRKVTTRRYHFGTQYVAAKLNGVPGERAEFLLLEK